LEGFSQQQRGGITMAIGHLYTQSGGLTIMNLGPATAENYRRSGNKARALLKRAEKKAEREIIGGMISECEYVSEWLETGRRPGSMRGVERAYEVRMWDPKWLEEYHSSSSRYSIVREPSRDLTDDERFKIEEAMHECSPREKQCFILYHADGLTLEEIGMELHLGKSTVQTYIERATVKIENAKLTSLFLLE